MVEFERTAAYTTVLPKSLHDRLKECVKNEPDNTNDTIVKAVDEYLTRKGY